MSEQDITERLEQIRQRAENLYRSRKYMCAESVLVSVNEGLGGGLSEDTAVRLAAPFSMGIGGSGCACGALSGGVMAVGLLLGNGDADRDRRRARRFSRQLHSRFKEAFGSACCRVLCRNVKEDGRRHFRHCARLTADTAVLTARLILEQLPERLQSGDADALSHRYSTVATALQRVIGRG